MWCELMKDETIILDLEDADFDDVDLDLDSEDFDAE